MMVYRILYRFKLWFLSLFREQVLVLGDSHAAVFKINRFVKAFPDYVFNVCNIGGATISGLNNPNSKTQAMPTFLSRLGNYKGKKVIVLLGEVDTGFVIWFRADKYNEGVDTMLETTIESYKKFISELSIDYKVLVINAPLPTIQDGTNLGGVANARKSIKATQYERTKITIALNNAMVSHCKNNENLEHLDLDHLFLNEKGLIRKHFYNKDPKDHHYDNEAYSKVLIEQIRHTNFL